MTLTMWLDEVPPCDDPACYCRRPMEPCPEFDSTDGEPWCDHCGWVAALHPEEGEL